MHSLTTRGTKMHYVAIDSATGEVLPYRPTFELIIASRRNLYKTGSANVMAVPVGGYRGVELDAAGDDVRGAIACRVEAR